jgi:hypothetical protein
LIAVRDRSHIAHISHEPTHHAHEALAVGVGVEVSFSVDQHDPQLVCLL